CRLSPVFRLSRRPPRSTLFPTRRSSDLGQRLSHRLAWIRSAAPQGPRPPPAARLRSRRNRPLHRLVAVLPDLGPCGQLSEDPGGDRKSTRLNSSHGSISYAVFCLKQKKQ